ncbi:MAG TPA: site-2 protease family protein, partial [Piscirickettsiaceae bacterium]|nr:site-2 protease family protein [Piscirickettsiaceae bacterium]
MGDIQSILIWVIPVLFAITVHEVAHGWVAYQLGDGSAKMMGRLTLNPIKHIDPFGTIIVPALLYLASVGFIFGWAKPVPVNFDALHSPKRDMLLVAIAGPGVNLLMSIGWLIVV